jgi:steroid 5-alpha reductase family enzyme
MLTTPEVALIVAGIALLGTAVTVGQKRYADRRDAWWGRTQWALEHIVAAQGDDDTERAIGLAMLTALQGSRLATDEERAMLEQVADVLLLPLAPDE